jgi:hypothetical protein
MLTRANELLVLVPGIADSAKFGDTLRTINVTLHYTMIFTAIITAVEGYKQLRRLFRIGSNAATSASTSA